MAKITLFVFGVLLCCSCCFAQTKSKALQTCKANLARQEANSEEAWGKWLQAQAEIETLRETNKALGDAYTELLREKVELAAKYNADQQKDVADYNALVGKYNALLSLSKGLAYSAMPTYTPPPVTDWTKFGRFLGSVGEGAATGSQAGTFGGGWAAAGGQNPTYQTPPPRTFLNCISNTVGDFTQTTCD